ncbi:hypothetical protein Hypma_005346 [Hypsizygus marmoreus]|uniref:Uncharacterized protein n=1 Tax=Hypsizygus marmoreus TaxID=39966 RepID=A0A369JWJ0_HYPMA|nr:hypothetical protein Hypma_005346 [Hypsizygus marmoreus]
MDDGDHEGSHTALHSDPRIILATTLATLVIAGSVFVWRSNIVGTSHQRGESAHRDPDSVVTSDNICPGSEVSQLEAKSPKHSTAGTAIIVSDELGDHTEAKELKNSRSKERRRRGKDPLKDMLKNAKKSKALVKATKSLDPDDSGTGQPTALPKIRETMRHSRETSQATSSRSVSTSSTSNHRSRFSTPDRQNPSDGSHAGGDDDATSSSTPTKSEMPVTRSQTSSSVSSAAFNSHPVDILTPSDLPIPLQTPDFPSISLSASSSASVSSSMVSSDSVITPNTSPTLSLSGKTPTLAQAEPLPAHKPKVSSASSPPVRQTQKFPGPWDWDGAGPTATPDVPPPKPPRFRSKSRGSGAKAISPPPQPFDSSAVLSSDASSSSPCISSPTTSTLQASESAESHGDESLAFTFPTLNALPGPSVVSPVSPGPSRVGNNGICSGNLNGSNPNGNGHTHRRAPTPRRPPTPLSGTSTPPPSVSTQTQLASLRGALEAARMREEKTKAEIERYTKDLEMARWEITGCKRREGELQNQINHLLHQVQTYNALFSSISGQPSPITPLHGPGSNVNATGLSNPNGYQFSPSSVPHSPPHLQIPSPAQMLMANGLHSASLMLSPMAMHSPFYPYTSHSHLQHPQVSPQLAQSPHQPQPNLFSMLFPQSSSMAGAGAPSGSRPSSVAGSSSVGSHSPDLAGSSTTPPPMLFDRGRRRTRTRTQTAGPRIGGPSNGGAVWDGGEGGGDGWIVEDDELLPPGELENVESEDEDEEGGFSEVLADAILKRPGSIRGLSKKGKLKEKADIRHTEFTFPSLSDFGNASMGSGGSAEPLVDLKAQGNQDEIRVIEVVESMEMIEAEVSDNTAEALESPVSDQLGTATVEPEIPS